MMRNRWRVTDNLIYEFRCILEKFAKLKDDLTCGAKKRNTSGWTEVLSAQINIKVGLHLTHYSVEQTDAFKLTYQVSFLSFSS